MSIVHGLAAEQVFEIDLADLRQNALARHQCGQRRQHHGPDAGAHAEGGEATLRFDRCGWNCDDRVFGFRGLGPVCDFADRTQYLIAVDFAPVFRGIVIEQTGKTPLTGARQFTGEARAGTAGAENQHGLALPDQSAVQIELLRRPIERTCTTHRKEQQHR